MIRVLFLESPLVDGYATLSGIHKYFHELALGAGDQVEYVYLDAEGGKHGIGAHRETGTVIPNGDIQASSGWRKLVPFWLRLIMGYWRDSRALAKRLRPYRGRVDILHVVAGGCEISPIAAKLAGFPLVLDTVSAMHGEGKEANHFVRRLIERLCFRCVDYHIFNADATRESWEHRIGFDSPRCCTIFIGMRPPDYSGYNREAYRARLCADPHHTFLVGISARLAKMKGHIVLLQAFKSLVDENAQDVATPQNTRLSREPHIRLLVAGEGEERPYLETAIKELGLDVHVRLLGHCNDPCAFTASLDLHVLPSLFIETMGYANIESMFAGVPCVVSDTGGMKEIVGVPGAGIVVPAGNVKALADAIRTYWHDAERRRRDGERGRRFAYAELTAEAMVCRTHSIYRQMTGKHFKDL